MVRINGVVTAASAVDITKKDRHQIPSVSAAARG
ncbi:hypothetical protein Q5A_001060 [Serratia inhibens PRI-2C]|nr:hypothetical protein Q5A_001060 [Serratia inhibens PRI-2C]